MASKKATYLICVLILCFMPVLFACEKQQGEAEAIYKRYPFQNVMPEQNQDEAKNIYLITKVAESIYWDVMRRGAEAAANEGSCNLYVGSTSVESDIEGQTELLNDAVAAGADAIILSPSDSDAMASYTQEIYGDIPLILVDTILNADFYDICYMTDNMQAGSIAAEALHKQLIASGASQDENIQIALQISSSTSQTILDRLAGFLKYWAEQAPENWEISDDVFVNDSDVKKATEHAAYCMEHYENLRAFVGLNNSSTQGVAQCVLDAERNDIAVVGFDYSDPMATLVESGTYHAATLVQNQYEMGYQAVKAALQILNGETMPYKFVDTGVLLVDHSNVKNPSVQELLNR